MGLVCRPVEYKKNLRLERDKLDTLRQGYFHVEHLYNNKGKKEYLMAFTVTDMIKMFRVLEDHQNTADSMSFYRKRFGVLKLLEMSRTMDDIGDDDDDKMVD